VYELFVNRDETFIYYWIRGRVNRNHEVNELTGVCQRWPNGIQKELERKWQRKKNPSKIFVIVGPCGSRRGGKLKQSHACLNFRFCWVRMDSSTMLLAHYFVYVSYQFHTKTQLTCCNFVSHYFTYHFEL